MRFFARKYMFVLWTVLFAGAYLLFAYYSTHVVISDAYVQFINTTLDTVNGGVVLYLMDNFKFFLISLAAVSLVMLLLLWGLRQGLVRLSDRLGERENVHSFAKACGLLMDFIIAVGFVFLLGIKDNFFEMYYVLFEPGLTERDITVHRMAYDVEMNWIFCEVLILKMLFDTVFHQNTVNTAFQKLDEKRAPVLAAENAAERSVEE